MRSGDCTAIQPRAGFWAAHRRTIQRILRGANVDVAAPVLPGRGGKTAAHGRW